VPRYSITFGAGSWEIPNLHCSAEATVINVLLTAPDIKERPANELPWMEEAHGKTEYQRNGKRCAGRG